MSRDYACVVSTRRPVLLLAPIVLIAAACGTPNPSPSTTAPASASVASTAPSAPAASTAPTVTPTPTPTVTPTPTPAATPVAVLPKRGAEVFDSADGVWRIAASTDNLGRSSRTFVHRRLEQSAEVYVACVGTGTLHVTVDAVKDAYSPGVSLVDEVVECPNVAGELLSLSTNVPIGWSPNPDAAPSDDSIRYQVLVGTVP